MSRSRSCLLTSGVISVELTLPRDTLMHALPAVAPGTAATRIAAALQQPMDLPALHECAIPGDRIVIVVDPETPSLGEILTQIIELLRSVDETSAGLTLLLPQDPSGENWATLLAELPVHIAGQTAIQVHDPNDENQRGYLATSSGGERVYLNRHLLDADLIVTVGVIGFDGLLGFRGTSSVIFPAFSDSATIRESRTLGHPELTPDQRRPLRDLIDEIGWLLGTQFSIQILPDASGGFADVLSGMPSSVQQAGQIQLEQLWRLSADDSYDMAIVSVPGGRSFGWRQIGAALETAARIVEQGGRIAIVADVTAPDGPGAAMLRRCQEPDDILKPLRKEPPVDAIEVTQLIHAARRARLYLLSHVPPEVVEELGMIPIASGAELQRLADTGNRIIAIPGANFVWCDVTESV